MKKLLASCALISSCLVATSASATVIDFNSVASSGGNFYVLGSVTADGFTFSSSHGHIIDTPPDCAGTCSDNGTKYIGGDMVDLHLVSSTNSIFSLGSFSLAEAFASLSIPTLLTLTGHHADSTTSIQTVSFDGIHDGVGSLVDFQNVVVNWSNLLSVDFSANGWVGIDNVNTEAQTSVPEPSTFVLFALAMFGLVASRRRA